jgi:hypothetical protein
MDEEIRYWDRIGAYVSRDFAEEYIERSQDTGITGEYLQDEIDEYAQITTISPATLRREIEDIFSKPYVEVELPKDTQALMDALAMESNKVKIIKGFMAEGLSKEEAKEKYTHEMNVMVGEALGIDTSDTQDSEDASNEEE